MSAGLGAWKTLMAGVLKDWDDYNSFPSPKGDLPPGGLSTLTFLGLCSLHFLTAFGDSGWCCCAAAGRRRGLLHSLAREVARLQLPEVTV